MGILTKMVHGAVREIIPMGQKERKNKYPNTATIRTIVKDSGMDPNKVDVIADGEDIGIDEEIGDCQNVTILPKQKGGFDLKESIACLILGYVVDSKKEDKELWSQIEARFDGGE